VLNDLKIYQIARRGISDDSFLQANNNNNKKKKKRIRVYPRNSGFIWLRIRTSGEPLSIE
jgi:hypothetical protein